MSNNTNRVNNPMKVITGPDTRWSYANVWEPKSINGGTPKYSVSLIIPKSDTKTVAKIKAAIEAAYQEGQAKLKGNGRSVPPLSAIKTPLRDVFRRVRQGFHQPVRFQQQRQQGHRLRSEQSAAHSSRRTPGRQGQC